MNPQTNASENLFNPISLTTLASYQIRENFACANRWTFKEPFQTAYKRILSRTDEIARFHSLRFYFNADGYDSDHDLYDDYEVHFVFHVDNYLVMSIEEQIETLYDIIKEMAFDYELNDFYPDPVKRDIRVTPEFLVLVLNLSDYKCDHSLESWRRILLLRAGIESNPGPASVDFVNLASRNFLLQDQTINQCAQENDGKLTWFVQIILNKYPSLSSVTFSSYNKKIAYELCYEQIMAKIGAKMTNNCFDLEPEMLQAFTKRRVVDAVHQSESATEGSHGETTSETMAALQTNLVSTTEESSGMPTSVKVLEQMKTTTENIGNYDNLTAQWYLIDEFEWGVTSPTLIREYVLPRDILANNIAANSPPLIPFNVNYLWRGTLEVRVQTKAQMFLTGQLQISSFYELNVDADAQMRRNIYSASQTNHTIINAGGSNDAVLTIPFVYRQPFVQIKQDSLIVGNNSCLDMVNVLIQVLNQLKVGTGSSDVSVAVFVRFIDSEFTGKRDGAIGNFDGVPTLSISDARHEMMSMLADVASVAIPGVGGMIGTGIRLAERALRQKKKTKNRDNPPVTGPTDMLIPYTAQNWANGTNIAEPLRTLRLDPVGQTPHPDSLEQVTQMSQIAQIFGLFRQIQWNENQNPGTTLLIVPCTPLMPASFYQLSSENPDDQLRFVPPVGVVASMYNLFRGPLEFRLDVVANKFYLGGLIMGYIPGIDVTTTVTNEMLRNSAFTTYSLDANNLSITYETPFINGAEWYNSPFAKPYNNAFARLPGCFVVNILQRLQQPENVNSEVDINVYMAGGSGFECANLTQPSLVVPSDATFVVNPLTVFNAVNFPPPNFLGSRPDTTSGFDTLDPIALTLGGGSGVFAAWNISSSAASFIALAVPPFELGTSMGVVAFSYFLGLRVGGNIRMYCIQQDIPNIDILISALNSIPYFDNPASRSTLAMITGSGPWFNTTGAGFANIFPHLRAIWTQGQGPLVHDVITDAVHESERDQRPNLVTSVQHYNTNNWGLESFGECFADVVDVLRRPVYNQDFNYVDSASNKFPNALFKMRVGPIPPNTDLEDPFDLVNRSSHSKIILSGYRYYRGGMRYRIVMPNLPQVYVWTQYDASDKISTDSIVYPMTGIATPVLTHSNPLDILTLQVNQVMNLEIPWYNSNQLNYLQRVNFLNLDSDQINATALGTITVGLSTNQTEIIPGSYTINVFSKIADDFAPYVFQGFPPMSFQSFLNPTEPVAEMTAEHEMMRNVIGRNVIKPIVAEVETEIGKVAENVRVQIGDVTNSIGEALTEIVEKIKKSANINLDFNWNIVITDLISQLGHCIMNPNIKTFIWSIITMLTKIGILSYNVIGKAVELFNNICKSVFGIYDRVTKNGTQQEPAVNLNAEHNMPSLSPSQTLPLPLDDVLVNNTAEFWSLIVASLAGLIGFGASAKYFNAKHFAWGLSRSLREFTMTANGLTSFLKLHLDTIKKILKSMCFWKSVEEFDPESMIVYNKSFIETWCKEVSYLTAPGMDTKIIGDSYLSDRVYLAFMIGEVIAKNVVSKTENKTNNAVLTSKLAQIRKLHEQCIMAGKTGAVRRETFGVWIDGDAGIGKSYIVEEISTRLILRGDISFEGEKTLTLNAADKYWSRCNKQPVLWIDDVFQCQTEEMIQSHLNAIFSVMSPTPLCPPMADLKDKDRIYEPRILMMTANSAFPNVKQVSSKAALWRRRNALIRCRMDHEHCRKFDPDYFEGKEAKALPAAALENYQHLWFSFAKTPKNKETQWIGPYKYERAMEYLDQLWDEFEEQSLRSYNHRLNKYYEAKRQVLPDYLNDMPNVPKHSNLFLQIKELAARLDNSALSIDEIHWNDMMEAKREKWVDKVFNVPKRMMALLVGRYPMFTYGVNSILTGHIPSRRSYNRYTVHGLGWDDPKHSDLCPAFDKPPLVTNVPKNSYGRRELGFNPFSKDYRDIVRKSHEMSCFGLTSEQMNQVEGAMAKDDVMKFADDLQQELVDLEDDESMVWDLFDVSAEHEMNDDDSKELKTLITSVGDTIRNHFLGRSDRLMLLLNHICSFRRTLKTSQVEEILNFYESTLNFKRDHLSTSTIVKLMYTKIAQFDSCEHYRLDRDWVYMKNTDKFVYIQQRYEEQKQTKTLSGGFCDDSHCALSMKLFKDHIYGFVRCPEGLPENCTYGIDTEIQKLVIDDVETFKDKCLLKLKQWSSALWIFLCEHYKSVIAILSVVVISWFVFFKPDTKNATDSEGAAYDKNKKLVEKRKVTSKRKLIKHNQAKEKIIVGEHEANQNVGDVMRKISNNIVFLQLSYTWEGIPKSKKFRVVMLRERQCLMIRHYIEDIQFYADHDPNAKLSLLVNGNNEVPLAINCVNEFSVLENQIETDFDEEREGTGYVLYNGLCVVDLPKTVREFPTITRHFVSAKDELRMSNNGILLMPEPGKGSLANTIVCENVKFSNYENLTVNAADTTSAVHLERVWMYRGVHGYGLCGSLLLNEDSGKIIGIHTAGSSTNNVGFSERLVYEEWEFVDEQAKHEVFVPNLEPITLDDHTLEGAVFPLGKVPKMYAQNNSGISQIRKSVIHGVCEVKTQPAPLTPYDKRLPEGCSPLYDGVAIHGLPPKEFPKELVDKAREDLKDLLIAKCIPVRPVQMLSLEEAVCGNPLIGLESIPLDTSEGYPLNKMRPKGCKGKGWLFNIERDEHSNVTKMQIHPELEKIMKVKDAMRLKGIKPFTVFTDVLKDETRPKAKCIKKAGTRIISMSPVDFTIQSRQVFGDFILAHGKCRSNLEHSIGVNTYSDEWTQIAKSALRTSNKIIAGDHSNFGPRMMTIVSEAVFKCIRDWYEFHGATEEHLQRLDIMSAELMNSVHLVFDILYQVMCGIISGSLFTAVFNSLCDNMYFRVAWLSITGRSFEDYYKHMYMTTYGDDNFGSVDDVVSEEFNVYTLHKFFAEYDLSYTDVHKNTSENMEKYCELKDASFLKTGWKDHPLKAGYYLPTLEKDSIENQLNWITTEGDAVDNTIVNCKSALRQAFGHGKEYYEQLANKIKAAFALQGHRFMHRTWEEQFVAIDADYHVVK
ncbi:polyprotein [Pityohyphantes rubrofasciatus iflavirus]|uniref:polyprotein n=1 Tax=Pityohyphantes rubrofasciatus iflavirus TaxID=1965238 RepID=UPI0009A484AE|nr:polyprotein [Pityohyphantes rubrofasciatus iflavirus]AQX17788.1 polyprotein [Pityohyphantes rubrofasciatus iflavirus]